MDIRKIAPDLSVSPQINPNDLGVIASQGFRSIIINRPDGETSDQPSRAAIEDACKNHNLEVVYLPVTPGNITPDNIVKFKEAYKDFPAPILAYCRTGTRSISLWALSQAGRLSVDAIIATAKDAGYDLEGLREKLNSLAQETTPLAPTRTHKTYDVVIIGGGAAGISTAASLLKRNAKLDIAIIEPQSDHFYQPGWTLVGGGVFKREQTRRDMRPLIPEGVQWFQAGCASFAPEENQVVLEDGERLSYRALIVAPGLKLNWDGIDGLKDTLGKNGVTSNYLFDMAPYTWELIQSLRGGKALFTQPPMPIKCAGAPQKAMYLACDAWKRNGRAKDIDVSFHNAGGVLFGVEAYVPALMEYIKKYDIDLHFNERLIALDGNNKAARFEITKADGQIDHVERNFDMIHVCPPQMGHDFIKNSPLADEAGWVDVDGETLQHVKYGNIFGLGDAASTPNAKTAAAVRKQAPVAAENVIAILSGQSPKAVYNGYGSCPLTVERGKIVLAEFAYGGKLDPSFPSWMFNGTKPTSLAWFLKEKMLPPIYFDLMLKGNETLAKPKILPHAPMRHEAQDACQTGK